MLKNENGLQLFISQTIDFFTLVVFQGNTVAKASYCSIINVLESKFPIADYD